MLKCKVCFFQKLPSFTDNTSDPGRLIPPAERIELVHIALAQSADAVTVKDGEAVCEAHILTLGDMRR